MTLEPVAGAAPLASMRSINVHTSSIRIPKSPMGIPATAAVVADYLQVRHKGGAVPATIHVPRVAIAKMHQVRQPRPHRRQPVP